MVGGQQKVMIWYFSRRGKNFGSRELPNKMIAENTGAFDPLAEDLAPRMLGPAGIGYGKVAIIVLHVLPEPCCHDMAQRVTGVMEHHLRFSRCPGDEINQHRIDTLCPEIVREDPEGRPVQISSTLEALSRSVLTIRNLPLLIHYRISRVMSIVGHGAKTALNLMSAMAKIHHSGMRGSMTSTRSPLLIGYP